VTRLFFCTDVHGSDVCFRKFLHAGPVYNANVVILGGDCTGKMLVPFVHAGNGTYRYEFGGEAHLVPAGEELETHERRIRNSGLYPIRLSQSELEALELDPAALRELFQRAMLTRLEEWMALAEERLRGKGVRVVVTPGNDDDFAVDPVIEASEFVEAGNDRVITIGDRHEMLSIGWSNRTPWDTPRECGEDELAGRVAALAGQVRDMDNAIFNIHVPPYGSGLDFAPELDANERMKRGGAISTAVGSTAVRDAILAYQPLLTLHGHIHESRNVQRLGRTLSINPGSSYSDWRLQGVIVDLADKRVTRYVPVTA
jgi:Icc-related predicted phosphoesterase